MADTNIPATPADGNVQTVLVPEVADINAITVAEATAATAVDISCYLTAGGFALTLDQQTITDERECDTITRRAPGRSSASLELTVIDNTNSTHEATANEAVEALVEGSSWVVIRRRGKAHTVALASGDRPSFVGRLTIGKRREVPSEANSVLRSAISAFVGEFSTESEIVAGG